MEPHLPCGPSLPQEAPQEEESKTTKQEQRPSTKEKVFHTNLILPLALITFKVGCQVEQSIQCLKPALTIE
jgi:hypothetical protein